MHLFNQIYILTQLLIHFSNAFLRVEYSRLEIVLQLISALDDLFVRCLNLSYVNSEFRLEGEVLLLIKLEVHGFSQVPDTSLYLIDLQVPQGLVDPFLCSVDAFLVFLHILKYLLLAVCHTRFPSSSDGHFKLCLNR